MSWFWGSKDDSKRKDDAYSKLDPTLRDFLDKESPLKHEDQKPKSQSSPPQLPPSQPSRDGAPNTYRSQLGLDTPAIDQQPRSSETIEGKPAVPQESLFPDGRYAHLWKTYRSKEEVEAVSRSDQDRLTEIVEAYNERRAAIGRAAIDNCVNEQIAEKHCYTHGSYKQLMTMCKNERRAFHRCFNMQSRFLKALGYLAMNRSAEEEEKIQMHADRLYQEMLEREQKIKEAKEAGIEAPELPPLIQADSTIKALGEDSAWARARGKAAESGIPTKLSAYAPEEQKMIKKRLEGLSKQERELELQLILAESRAKSEYAEQIANQMGDERESRAMRRARGTETAGDTIKRWWGWDQ